MCKLLQSLCATSRSIPILQAWFVLQSCLFYRVIFILALLWFLSYRMFNCIPPLSFCLWSALFCSFVILCHAWPIHEEYILGVLYRSNTQRRAAISLVAKNERSMSQKGSLSCECRCQLHWINTLSFTVV